MMKLFNVAKKDKQKTINKIVEWLYVSEFNHDLIIQIETSELPLNASILEVASHWSEKDAKRAVRSFLRVCSKYHTRDWRIYGKSLLKEMK